MTLTASHVTIGPPVPVPQRRWLVGFVVASIAGVALSYAEATSQPILGARWTLLDVVAAWAGVWVVGVVCALRLPGSRKRALLAIGVVAVVLRVAGLASGPTLSDDLYRYSWDARVQLAGIDPYRYPPTAPALRALREPYLWPDATGCASINRPPGCTRINRPTVRTIYPPVAEGWFTAVYRIGGGIGTRYKLWQGAGVVTELATLGLMALVLKRRGRDPRWLALYALCPAPAIEVVNDGHVDGLAIMFLMAAFLALCPPLRAGRDPASTDLTSTRGTRIGESLAGLATWRAALAGALIGASTMVKLYPLVALLAVWLAPGLRWRHRIASGAAAVGVIIVGYAPHVAAVGVDVIGFLPGYLKEEQYTGSSSRFLLADLFHLHGHVADAAVGVAIAATVIWLMVRRRSAPEACALLVGILLLAATPVQPWYAVTLVALATVAVRPRWSIVVAAGYPYFFAVILSAVHQEGLGQIAYGTAALTVLGLCAFEAARRHRSPSSHRLAQTAGSSLPRHG